MTWAEDRAPVGTDPSADPGAVSERRAAGCRPPSPFAYSTNAINPIRNYYLPPANPRLPGFHFTLNQDRCRPPSPFAYSTNAINPIRNYYLPPANPRLPGFHFTLNQDKVRTPHVTEDPRPKRILARLCARGNRLQPANRGVFGPFAPRARRGSVVAASPQTAITWGLAVARPQPPAPV